MEQINYQRNICYISYNSKSFTLKEKDTIYTKIPQLNLIQVQDLEEELINADYIDLILI